MSTSQILMIVVLILLIIGSAYFSATETAFSSINRIRIKNRAEEEQNKKAILVLKLSADFDKLISTILIGNNIVNITATALATVLFTELVGTEYGPTVATIVLTIVVLLFGEISPKTVAKEHPERFAMAAAPLLRVFIIVLTPLNALFSLWQKLVSKIFHSNEDHGITDEELKTMVSEAENEGGLDAEESELIRAAIEFDDLEVSDIFTPRVDVVAISREADFHEVAQTFTSSGFSRLPVYEKTVDNIIGVIHEKDFYAARYRGETEVKKCISRIYYTTPSTHIDELMRCLQQSKMHMAVVVDEYGGTKGIVTMEDIIEELVGEIWDEHDEIVKDIHARQDGSYIVSCSTALQDLYDLFSIREEVEFSTVSGWVVDCLEHVPKVGDTFDEFGLRVVVTKVARRRALEIHVREIPEEESDDSRKDH